MPVKTENTNSNTTAANAAGASNGVASPPLPKLFCDDPTDDPAFVKNMQRPAVIKEDLYEMERRKRVRQILESKAFREELENLIISERQLGNNADNLRTLEQLSELISPTHQSFPSSAFPAGSLGISHALTPVADIRGPDAAKYTLQERVFRNKLASLYRLVDLFQWSQGIYNHITFRLSSKEDHILINPFGLLYHEITASSLVKIDLEGRIIDNGSTSLGVNEAGYVLHTAIHKARPDVRCIIHLHTPVVVAVTAMKCGLLPISQDAMMVGHVSYHDFQGIVNDEKERESLINDLGPVNKIMVLRNHGFVVCGSSLEDTFRLTSCFVSACETQIRAARAGVENLVVPSEEAQRRMLDAVKQRQEAAAPEDKNKPGVKWKLGELEWEAWMRVLDNAGFRTGHIYKQPVYRIKAPASQSDVEVPPAATSYGLLEETDETDLAQRVAQIKRDQERVRWLNSPNLYQKVEFEETGTSEPKKLTKWVQDESNGAHATTIKIASPHQFSPLSINTREFKDKQKAIKENRRAENLTAGPQSRVLDGVTWQEAGKLKDAEISGTQERIMIGAASKGIIEREYRHNAQIYRQLYQPNPFVSATDEDIQRYMHDVEEKTRGGAPPRRSESDHLERTTTTDDGRSDSPESVSLMQAARDIERREPPIGHTLETTFEASTDSAYTTALSPAKTHPPSSGWFRRSKSARYYSKPTPREGPVTSGNVSEDKALSEEEGRVSADISPGKKEKKKKKFKTPSIFKGKKDKKK